MDMESSKARSREVGSEAKVHGFQVQSYGKRLSTGFRRALKRLLERGFDDPTCVVVKTTNGKRSGITHEGGRYVHAESLYRAEVIRQMRELGMEPPPPPFVITPGEYTLYHEWGHHVDRTWSFDDQEITFSFRWFTRFYSVSFRPPDLTHGLSGNRRRPLESKIDASPDALLLWWHASSELFADLFEDWMRGEKMVSWDQSEPKNLRMLEGHLGPRLKIELMPGVRKGDVRSQTYDLFKNGIRFKTDLPPVRPHFFGQGTDEIVRQMRHALHRLRVEGQFGDQG